MWVFQKQEEAEDKQVIPIFMQHGSIIKGTGSSPSTAPEGPLEISFPPPITQSHFLFKGRIIFPIRLIVLYQILSYGKSNEDTI